MNEKLAEMFLKLIDGVEAANPDQCTEESLLKNYDTIKEIADYARKTLLYKGSVEQGAKFFEHSSAPDIYMHMLNKIAESPNRVFADSAIILSTPFLEEKLKKIIEEPDINGSIPRELITENN